MKYIIEICVAIDIAILGIAYPILIDKISNIGQKYNSEYLPNVFDSEYPDNKAIGRISIFQLILILTLISFVFQIFLFEPIDYLKGNVIVENSADILVFTLTLFLTGSFFYWVNKIMLFQGKASELLKYLINKYDNKKEEDQSKTYLLKTINEFALFAIEKQDIHLQESLLDFYFEQFQRFKENHDEEVGPEFPFDLYYITNEIIESSVNHQNKKLKALEHRATSGTWFYGESFKFAKISRSTYTWLWRNLITSSNHKSLIANYWSSASQYFNYSLSGVMPEYGEGGISNQSEIDKVEKERKHFLELNYALGGLLYHKDEHNTLKYILSFSQSQPPSYPLLPQTMDEIFYWFEHFSNAFKLRADPIEYKYAFPEIDNLGISRSVVHNICLYISLLFVRQFTQQTIYVFQDFKIFHNLTDDLQELYSYNDRLPYFKNCVEAILSNQTLLNTLDYQVEREEVLSTFDGLAKKIKNKIDVTKLHANLSEEKIETFKNSTRKIIKDAFDQYKTIENKKDFTNVDDRIISSINGEVIVSSKSSFTDNDIPNINYDTVFAQSIANRKIKYFIPNSFLLARTDKYLIERIRLIDGLERIIKDPKGKVIVAIGPGYDTKQLIAESKFKDILIEIPSTNNRLNDTFFILDKRDLPKFDSKELLQKEIDKFGLTPLDDTYKLYSAVVDINLEENKALKEEFSTNDEKELKVLILISFIFLIKWKKDRKVIMLGLTSPYQERGIVNTIEDLSELN
ncbi:hypothetical protein SAMN04487891_102459 [Flagellimonas taeanensis]|uniref:Uncharacterized protein n=1 Tax=Flagellimonas taeanensis TaxID=1005926 RepID=A0A1M6SIC4_9FLAO|nr:hypothetical protein [Allomuricauda taeanensis]SFB80918.1 hypothetical protein SAMN04487891_102459 [Allomuricauda taeanensis]SHK44369.1 hypothetical protein SAMN05216293_1140 [Allomuricauda taeanensis]